MEFLVVTFITTGKNNVMFQHEIALLNQSKLPKSSQLTYTLIQLNTSNKSHSKNSDLNVKEKYLVP